MYRRVVDYRQRFHDISRNDIKLSNNKSPINKISCDLSKKHSEDFDSIIQLFASLQRVADSKQTNLARDTMKWDKSKYHTAINL